MKFLFSFLMMLILLSCVSDNKKTYGSYHQQSDKILYQGKHPCDTLKPFISNFIKWYFDNISIVLSIQNKMIITDSDIKKLDKAALQNYLTILKKSGYFHESYIENLNELVVIEGYKIEKMQKNYGGALNSDLILRTQEYMDVPREINSNFITIVDANIKNNCVANLKLIGGELIIKAQYDGGSYKITEIFWK